MGSLRDHALAAIDRASRLRGLTPRGEAGSDDIEDPIGAPETVYLQRADEIRDGCFQALDLLVGVRH